MGERSDGRMEQPVPELDWFYQKRFIAFCMFNYYKPPILTHHLSLNTKLKLIQQTPTIRNDNKIYQQIDEQLLIKIIVYYSRMHGKYHDTRVYQHYVHTYSRVPYLDNEIFNIETNALKQSRKANQRAVTALQGLQRTQQKSDQLTNSIRNSRLKRQEEAKQFMLSLQKSQESCLQKQRATWNEYSRQRQENELSYIKGQKYLQSLLKSNSTKAESRLTEVRRWI